MAKKTSELDAADAIADTHLFPISQDPVTPGTFVSRKATGAQLLAYLGGGPGGGSAAAVQTISTTTHDFVAGDVGKYNRFTNAGAKTANIQDDATEPMPDDAEIHVRNADTTTSLQITADGGVTLNLPADGTDEIPPGGTATLKRVAEDEWDLFGQVVAA